MLQPPPNPWANLNVPPAVPPWFQAAVPDDDSDASTVAYGDQDGGGDQGPGQPPPPPPPPPPVIPQPDPNPPPAPLLPIVGRQRRMRPHPRRPRPPRQNGQVNPAPPPAIGDIPPGAFRRRMRNGPDAAVDLTEPAAFRRRLQPPPPAAIEPDQGPPPVVVPQPNRRARPRPQPQDEAPPPPPPDVEQAPVEAQQQEPAAPAVMDITITDENAANFVGAGGGLTCNGLIAAVQQYNQAHPQNQIPVATLEEYGNNRTRYMAYLRTMLDSRANIIDTRAGRRRYLYRSNGRQEENIARRQRRA